MSDAGLFAALAIGAITLGLTAGLLERRLERHLVETIENCRELRKQALQESRRSDVE